MSGSEPEDFEITKYRYDREHELELNRFAHVLEVEQLKLLILLNGGAAAALLTFAQHRSIEAANWWFALAIGCWTLGLFLGAYATIEMQFVQTKFARSFRHRRCATEWRQLGAKYGRTGAFTERLGLPDEKLRKEMKANPPGTETAEEIECLADTLPAKMTSRQGAWLNDRAAKHLLKDGQVSDIRIHRSSVAGVVLFILGAAAATASIIAPPAAGEVQSNRAGNIVAAR